MNSTKDKLLQDIGELIEATDEVLNGWTGENNLQFPVLLGMIAVRYNWDEKQVRRADPFVREYIRNHPDWYVTRGAKGGIMRASVKNKKEAAKSSKDAVKKQMQALIESKVASLVGNKPVQNVVDTNPASEDDTDDDSNFTLDDN
jgi:ElaB/YqjD/DUF883 family membrane-anchored ribosome-binding protein